MYISMKNSMPWRNIYFSPIVSSRSILMLLFGEVLLVSLTCSTIWRPVILSVKKNCFVSGQRCRSQSFSRSWPIKWWVYHMVALSRWNHLALRSVSFQCKTLPQGSHREALGRWQLWANSSFKKLRYWPLICVQQETLGTNQVFH